MILTSAIRQNTFEKLENWRNVVSGNALASQFGGSRFGIGLSVDLCTELDLRSSHQTISSVTCMMSQFFLARLRYDTASKASWG